MAVEYDHLFMGNRNVSMTSTGTFLPVGALSRTDNIGQDVDLVTVRVNYRWGALLSRSTELRFHQTKYRKAGLAPAIFVLPAPAWAATFCQHVALS